MDIEDATLPDGVDPADVEFSDEYPDALAFDTSVDDHYDWGRFDPRNGRRYRTSPGYDTFPFDSAVTAVGHEIHCVYQDCDGQSTAEAQIEYTGPCPECGAGLMGREQFTRESRKRRSDRRAIETRTRELRDEFSREMARLTDADVGAISAMDYLMCSVGDIPAGEWAEARGIDEPSVRRNMSRTANKLGETVTFSV